MIEVGQSAEPQSAWAKIRLSDCLGPEKFARSPSLVANHEAFLPGPLDLKDLHDGTVTRLDVPDDVLIDFERIFGRLLEENGVGNGPDVGFSVKELGLSRRRKGEMRWD